VLQGEIFWERAIDYLSALKIPANKLLKYAGKVLETFDASMARPSCILSW
jgi:hypothetical protein